MNKNLNIGVSGDPGSFSEAAAQLYIQQHRLKDLTLHYLLDMEGVLAAVEQKTVDLGIFPIINWRGGLVKPALQAMGKHSFIPADEIWLDVHQCLLALPGTSVTDIKKIVSHPQAILQCQKYLSKHHDGCEITEWIDTAKAAKDLANHHLAADVAVIAPKRAADLYHLTVIAESIQDDRPNFTVFVVVKH